MNLEEIEKNLIKQKSWEYMGEVDKRKRPVNSLLDKHSLQYDVTEPFEPISSKQNQEIFKMTLQRLREGTFDNFDFSKQYEAEEEEEVINNEDENKDIEELYNEIESELIKISDFGAFGYLPDVEVVSINKKEIKMPKRKQKVKDLGKIKNVTVFK